MGLAVTADVPTASAPVTLPTTTTRPAAPPPVITTAPPDLLANASFCTAQTVVRFYILVPDHQFARAALLWSPTMGAAYPLAQTAIAVSPPYKSCSSASLRSPRWTPAERR